jgi:hypothetical protein
MPSRPIQLTDHQLAVIQAAAEPLRPCDRGAFLEVVAALLREVEVGDGTVARACAAAQRKFFDAPELSPDEARHTRPGKYA